MASKAERKRRRRTRAITLPGGGASAPKIRQGRRTDTEDSGQVALQARVRRQGLTADEAGLRTARDPLRGDPLGLCIIALHPGQDAQADLWRTWQALGAAKLAWGQRIIGALPQPQAAAVAMLPEPMQTDQGHSVDLRTPDERDRSAADSWHRWLSLLMRLPADQRHALRGHLDGYGVALWHEVERRPTRAGCLAVKALGELHDATRA